MNLFDQLLRRQARGAATSAPMVRGAAPASEMPRAERQGEALQSTPSVLVALTGDALDEELLDLACAAARERHASFIHAVYCLEVPRCKPVNDELPAERAQALAALDHARTIANREHVALRAEYLQTRSTTDGLLRLAESDRCSLLVIGLSRSNGEENDTGIPDTVAQVLLRAPCRVWVVRQQCAPLSLVA
jgi:hypothetical protein